MEQDTKTVKQACAHCQTAILPNDEEHNRLKLSEQKEIRQPGESFWFNQRYTCLQCLEFVFIPKHMRRK